MADKEEIVIEEKVGVDDNESKETESPVEQAGTTNSEDDAERDSDIDLIFEEIAAASSNEEKSSDEDSDEMLAEPSKPKSIKDTSVKSTRGQLVGRGGVRGLMHRGAKLRMPKIPEGILYVRNGSYIGYHCTYCNCALKTLLTLKQHVAGARHTEALDSLKNNEQKIQTKIPKQSDSSLNSDLKSSLNEYLDQVSEPIVGLNHIDEIVELDKPPNFVCNLCKYSSNSDEMKDHITGTRHRLMYLKSVDPKRIAEMMATNMKKNERNEKILEHAKELEKTNGRGRINVKSDESEEMKTSFTQVHRGALSRQRRAAKALQIAKWRNSLRVRGKLYSIRRGIRGIRGGRRLSSSRARRMGNSSRGRILKRSRLGSNRGRSMRQLSYRSRGRISHSSARASDPYLSREPYSDWAMGMVGDQYGDPYYGRDPYYSDLYPAPRDYYTEVPYEQHDPRNSYEGYSYRQHYEDDFRPGPSESRQHRSVSPPPSQNRSSFRKNESTSDTANIEHLPGIKVTSEKDAGVVMNVITSLAESLLGYKMKNTGSAQELLEKLNDEKVKTAYRQHPPKRGRAAAKFSRTGRSSTRWRGRSSRGQIQYRGGRGKAKRLRGAMQSRSPPRRQEDVLQERSPPAQRSMESMRSRMSPPPRDSMGVRRDRSPLRGPMGAMHSPPPPRSKVNHPSYVDDLFDDYQKVQSTVRDSYSASLSNANAYQSSYPAPSYGAHSSYEIPSYDMAPSYSRSSEMRQLAPTGSSYSDSQERNMHDWNQYHSYR